MPQISLSKFSLILLLGLISTSYVSADVSFQADVAIYNDPSMPGAIVYGHLNYYYNTSVSAINHAITLTYQKPVQMTETWVFEKALHYRHCQHSDKSCFAETYKLLAPIYFVLPTDTPGSTPFGSCQQYTRTSGDVKSLWIDPLTSNLCKVQINGISGNRTIVFNNYIIPASSSQLNSYTGWSCPAPVCNRIMDVMLVLDESTSISATDWTKAINFTVSLVNSYNIASNAVTMGVVFFSTQARVVSYLSNDAQSIINSLQTNKAGGYTCIGCGMSLGLSLWDFPISGRTQLHPARMMIVITDGQNNRPGTTNKALTNLTNSANNVHNANIMTFAIGVGSGADTSELTIIASRLPTGSAVIQVSNYSALQTIMNQLVTVTCSDLPTQPCGLGCNGFCGCNAVCSCPQCQDLGKCFTNNCTLTNGQTVGCVAVPVDCDDHNACTTDTCDNVDGCHHTIIDLNQTNPCLDQFCSSTAGPYTLPHQCDDHNACTSDRCDPAIPGGCVYTDQCHDPSRCVINSCDNQTGCYTTPVSCDDHNECTDDLCDPLIGCQYNDTICQPPNQCLVADPCDPTIGCRYKARDCSGGINDPCVVWTCDPVLGCLNHSVPCAACNLNPLNCTDLVNHRCQEGACTDINGLAVCEYTNWTQTQCNSHNPCILDTCDITTQTCHRQPVNCTYIPCTDVVCNPLSGHCDRVDRDCSVSDPCWIGYCNPTVDQCRRKPRCPSMTCQQATCLTNGTCVYRPLSCDSGNQCLLDRCNQSTGICQHLNRICNDGLKCTDNTCNPTVRGGCVFIPKTCDDHNPCTIDYCNETVGCYHIPKCNDGLYCTEDICTTNGTCFFPTIHCQTDLTKEELSCFISVCSETRHCYKKPSPTAFLDVCGGCINTFGTNASIWNSSEARTTCLGTVVWPKLATVLTAAAVAGIIIAAIVGAVIVAVSGFFGTRELIRRARSAQSQTVINNPIYMGNLKERSNPVYAGRELALI